MISWRRKSFTHPNPNNSRGPRRSCRPRIEALEPRLVLFKSYLTLEPNHEMITSAALWFLKDSVVAEISLEHAVEELEQALNSAAHFDNCNFRQASARINDLYGSAIRAADPNNFDSEDVADYFGKLLHPVQDFYSHSNWVDDGQTTLIDSNNDRLWDPLDAYSIHDGAMILQGHNPEPFGPGSLQRDGFVVTVNAPTGTYRGVLSGTFGFSDDCPTNVAVPHGSILSPHGLNKDSPNEYNGGLYQTAADLAIQQTSNEFDRLVNLVQATYGTAQPLLDAWLAPGAPHALGSYPHTALSLDQAVPAISKADFPRLFRQRLQRDGYQIAPQLLDALTSDDVAVRQQALTLLHINHAQPPRAGNDSAAAVETTLLSQVAANLSLGGSGLTATAILGGHLVHSFTGSANVVAGEAVGATYGHDPGMSSGVSAILHIAASVPHDYAMTLPTQGVDHKPG